MRAAREEGSRGRGGSGVHSPAASATRGPTTPLLHGPRSPDRNLKRMKRSCAQTHTALAHTSFSKGSLRRAPLGSRGDPRPPPGVTGISLSAAVALLPPDTVTAQLACSYPARGDWPPLTPGETVGKRAPQKSRQKQPARRRVPRQGRRRRLSSTTAALGHGPACGLTACLPLGLRHGAAALPRPRPSRPVAVPRVPGGAQHRRGGTHVALMPAVTTRVWTGPHDRTQYENAGEPCRERRGRWRYPAWPCRLPVVLPSNSDADYVFNENSKFINHVTQPAKPALIRWLSLSLSFLIKSSSSVQTVLISLYRGSA